MLLCFTDLFCHTSVHLFSWCFKIKGLQWTLVNISKSLKVSAKVRSLPHCPFTTVSPCLSSKTANWALTSVIQISRRMQLCPVNKSPEMHTQSGSEGQRHRITWSQKLFNRVIKFRFILVFLNSVHCLCFLWKKETAWKGKLIFSSWYMCSLCPSQGRDPNNLKTTDPEDWHP